MAYRCPCSASVALKKAVYKTIQRARGRCVLGRVHLLVHVLYYLEVQSIIYDSYSSETVNGFSNGILTIAILRQ